MNVKNKIPKSVKLKTYVVTVLLISVIFAGALNYVLSNGYVGEELEPWLTLPLQEASYIIGQYNSTHYYARNSTGYGTSANEGYEFLSTNATAIWQACLNNVSSGGSIFARNGDYNFGSSGLTITFPSADCEIAIIGETVEDTRFISSATKIIDITNNAWGSPLRDWGLRIENIEFRHSCESADAVTLDLFYCHPKLTNLRAFNTYYPTTRQGTAFKCGPSAGKGKPCSWIDVRCEEYGTGFNMSLDHITLINTMASKCRNYGYVFGEAYFVVGINTQVFNWDVADNLANLRPFYFDENRGANALYTPSFECKSGETLTNPIFSHSASYHCEVHIFGYSGTEGQTLADDYSFDHYYFTGGNYGYRTETRGQTLIYNGQTERTREHYCCIEPKVIMLTGEHNETKTAYISMKNITHFTITVPSAVTDNRYIYWWASING